ncbi:MAG: penicillin acylase family protein [Marinilabiliaceae bacterium]|jgi:acyl-homoserine lactone acylase PvdQ|nr:penicillin acylase family protein [Marinilabiliaceae bacterium]
MMKTVSKFPRSFFLLIIVLLLGSCSGRNDEVARWKQQAEGISIIRDNFGVPHIYGKTDADAVFGMIYAQCEDDFNRVEVNYINALGRMAEVEGEELIYTDLRMKLFIDPEQLKEEYRESPLWLRKLMDAFADGANYYLYTHPEVTPMLLTRFEPWMALAFSEGSIGGDIEKISVNGLKQFYGPDHNVAIANTGLAPDGEPRGSNGFAIAPTLNKNGNAMLLINPHTSFFFRSEVHMVSEEGLNAYGAVTWGQFFIYQGFNERCGWMHTSTKADAIDIYEETIVEEDGKYFYKYGEELRPVKERIITIPYKDGEEMSSIDIKAYYTHHGPVIRGRDNKWLSFSIMVEHVKALTQSYTRTKAQNYDEFYKSMELLTNSSNNTVYADADGNIAYFHGNFIPVRNPEYDYSGIIDGSKPETDWQGLHTVDEMIHILNPGNGWIQNCNQTPFTACLEFSPKREDYPVYMAPDAENPRGYHAVRVLSGQKDFDLDKLIDVAYDSYLPAFGITIPALVRAYDIVKRQDATVALELNDPVNALRDWDMRFSAESVPTTLAVYWGQAILGRSRGLEVPFGETIFDVIARELEAKDMIEALSSAVNTLKEDFGTWELPWGEVNRYQRINGEIRQPFNDDEPSLPVFFASSAWGSLASFGARTYPGTKKMYGTSGNSFVAFVEFGDKVVAKSILAGGISGDPESPHFDDQAEMYINGVFKDVLYYREDIEANAERTYHPGS